MDDRAAHVLETAEGKHKVGVVHVPGMQRSQSSCSPYESTNTNYYVRVTESV